MAEEGRNSSATEEREEQEEVVEGENEEFYETIEAPKFVDFTVPDQYRPDDRYWFCSRFGCDQKHEEELDSEAIYKNFVLRVMAARSPNVRLHKALNRNCSSKTMKCPLSVPPKSSKSRLSRLAVISSISLKKDGKKERAKPLSKACSTPPKTKGREVAAKYLTTPRNKKCIANASAFRSVQNTKPSNVVHPKNRPVAKTLTFPSPKKAFNLKTSVELRTHLTKLCQKLKKLEITSQKNPALAADHSSKQPKQFGHHSQRSLHSSARENKSNNDNCRRKISQKLITQQGKRDAEAFKGKNRGKSSKQTTRMKCCANETDAELRDDPVKDEAACPTVNGLSTNAPESKLESSSNSTQTDMAADGIPIPTSQTLIKEDDESETTNSDDKENVTAFDENRSFCHKNDHSGRNILGQQNSDRNKVVDKDWKGQATNGAPGLKLMKLKPTNPKPFKLRTEERGILREANLERKNNAMATQNEATIVSKCEGRKLRGQNLDTQKEIACLNPTKKEANTKTPTRNKKHDSKQELKPSAPSCESSRKQQKLEHELNKEKSSPGHKLQPQRHLYAASEARTPDKTTNATVHTSSGNPKSKELGKKCTKVNKVPACSPSPSSRGRTVTIPREPNFHRSHLPKSCTAKTS